MNPNKINIDSNMNFTNSIGQKIISNNNSEKNLSQI